MIRCIPDRYHPLPHMRGVPGDRLVSTPKRIVIPVRRGAYDADYITPPHGVAAVERDPPEPITPDGPEDDSPANAEIAEEFLDDEPQEAIEEGSPVDQSHEPPAPEFLELKREHEVAIEALHGFKARFDEQIERRCRQEQDAMLLELLPVQDNLDRALAEKGAEENAWIEGLASIRRQMLSFLSKHDVHALDALGEQFDPHFHDAISVVKDRAGEDGRILHVEEQGYLRGDKLLRPAKVIVMKDPEG